MHKKEVRSEEPLLYAKLEDETDKKKLTWQKATFALLVCFLVGLVAWRITKPADTSALNMDVNDIRVGAVPECSGITKETLGANAANAITTACKCGDTAECAVGKYCTQNGLDAKKMCGDLPQCVPGFKVDKKCVCKGTEACDVGDYCVEDGVFKNLGSAKTKCTKAENCGGVFGPDGTKALDADCACPLAKGGTVDCQKGKYCTGVSCADKALGACPAKQGDTAIKTVCACGITAETCAVGQYCYEESCQDDPAHSDKCTATSEICFDTRMPCELPFGMATKSAKVPISLDKCVKEGDDQVKYTCVKDGELSRQKYKDGDCKEKDGDAEKYKQGDCQMGLVKYSWSGKCGGVSSAGSISTLMTFVLAVLLMVV